MDSVQPNASAVGGSPPPAGANIRGRWIRLGISVLGTGLIVGVAAAVVSVWIPSNRIIVFNQTYGEYIKVASVRIARAGFIGLYVEESGGSRLVGSLYLPRGYYRNLALPIDTDYIIQSPETPITYVVRLFYDTGTGVLDDQKDIPVKNIFGQPVSESFWMEYAARPVNETLGEILGHPLDYITKKLLP
jgi:hypothetical protein